MKLVLFDIDGTLVERIGTHHSRYRFLRAINDVFGIDVPLDLSVDLLGLIDRQIAWTLVKPYGITEREFDSRFDEFAEALFYHTKQHAYDGKIDYLAIPEAVELVTRLSKMPDIRLGLQTGNTPKIAQWKLDYLGIAKLFPFGVYGDDVIDRFSLAKKIFSHAKRYFGIEFRPSDIVVIGDTVFDIRCGKAIGAKTIAVTTGGHLVTKVDPKAGTYQNALKMERPDLLVDSLMDTEVLDFFGITSSH